MRIGDWSSDVCSSDLGDAGRFDAAEAAGAALRHLWHDHLRRAAVPGAADRDRGERGAALDRQRRLPAPAVRVFEALLRRLARLDIVASPPRPEPARRSALLRAELGRAAVRERL